ncbi:MAG: HlyC/CorC family transporter [Dongiaceae bacterium]
MNDPGGLSSATLITLGVIVLLLLLSAFFSGSETALTAASRARLHALEQRGNRRAAQVNVLRSHMERVIGAILLGNNVVNITASALATSVMIQMFGENGVLYATIAVTAMVVIFGEILPKTYAINNPERLSLIIGPPMRIIVLLFTPITRIVQLMVNTALRLFGLRVETELGSERTAEELRGAIDLHLHAGADAEEIRSAGAMLHSILDLDDVTVSDIMVHRRKVEMIDLDLPPVQTVAQVLASPYTRLPLWQSEPDNIVGVLHAKALLRAVRSEGAKIEELDLKAIAADPWFIPDTTTLLAQLQAFRQRREHFAIVVDEYGAVRGIVTLEDILEEIVGQIDDEHDIHVTGVRRIADGSYEIDGGVTLRDLNREFGWRLPDEEASTIAGLVLYEARRIPVVGQVFVFHGFRFEVLERQRNQIKRLRVTPPAEAEAASA